MTSFPDCANHEGEQAQAALAEALVLAAPEGYVRTFVDEGTPMAVLHTRLVAAVGAEEPSVRFVSAAYAGRLLAAIDNAA